MDREFWLQRWTEGQIGFHQEQVNPYLVQHWTKLNANNGERVLVPLCGKSKDMLWLHRQGLSVCGVELSSLAVEAFFSENQLHATKTSSNQFISWHAPGYELLCGDFFNLTREQTGDISLVYDRASLIALPPEMRKRYAEHLTKLLSPQSRVLLVTMEYPQNEMSGPPFSVHEHEVRELYHRYFEIEVLGSLDVFSANPHFRQRGISQMMETSYRMVRKSR